MRAEAMADENKAVDAATAPPHPKIKVSIHPTPRTDRAKQIALAASNVRDAWNEGSAQ
jgi:hypothetical protein